MSTFKNLEKLLEIKRYSPNTVTTYIGLLRVFQDYIGDKHRLHRLDNKFLLQKIREIIIDKNYAYTTQKQLLSVLSLYPLFKPSFRRTSVVPYPLFELS